MAIEVYDLWESIEYELSADSFKNDSTGNRRRKISSKDWPNRKRFRFDDENGFDSNDGKSTSVHIDCRNAKIEYDDDDNPMFVLTPLSDEQKTMAYMVARLYGVDIKDTPSGKVILHNII